MCTSVMPSILIDPAYDDPGTAWDQAFAAKWPGITRTPGLAAGLASIGVRPEEITHVLITHAHDDHFAGVVADAAAGRARSVSRMRAT